MGQREKDAKAAGMANPVIAATENQINIPNPQNLEHLNTLFKINKKALRPYEIKRIEKWEKESGKKIFNKHGNISGPKRLGRFHDLVSPRRYQRLAALGGLEAEGITPADRIGAKWNKLTRDTNFKKMQKQAMKSGTVKGSPELQQQQAENAANWSGAAQQGIFNQPSPQALLQQLAQQQQAQPQFNPAFQPNVGGAGIFGLASQPSQLANYASGGGFSQINNPTILKAKGGA